MTEQLRGIRNVLTEVKDAFEEYFEAKFRYDKACSLLEKLKKLLEKYKKCIESQISITVLLLASLFLLIVSHGYSLNQQLNFKRYLAASACKYVSGFFVAIFLLYFLSLTYKRMKYYPNKYHDLLNEMISADKNDSAQDFRNIRLGEDLCNGYKTLIETSLLPKKNERYEFLLNEKMRLQPYVSEEYRGYDCVCACITIIDSNRADTLKELVNTMVDDMKNKEIVDAIRGASHVIKSGFDDTVSRGINKVTEKIDKVFEKKNNKSIWDLIN